MNPALEPVMEATLFVTKAVLATLDELSLVNCVGTDIDPFIETSPFTNILPLKLTSLVTNKRFPTATSLVKLAVAPVKAETLFVT